MIPNNKNTFTVDNNFGGEKVKMKISADATVHLMGLLTDLYSDQELACIREYSTNAFDSHIDADNTDTPIQVTAPTALDPYLTIRDFGVGMDEHTIRSIYSQYGESTKRKQKTTNGSMGIGAKAALGYTNQFNVTGIKNGVKTLVSVSRDEDGAGVMEIVFTGKTTEANGVEIKIPAKPGNQFAYKAGQFFQYWKKGTVLLNGIDPSETFEFLTGRIAFTTSRTDVIVMGNVAYPVDMNNYSISGADGRKVACFVEMNGKDEVVFTPSREGLIYNAITKSAVVNLRKEYQAKIREHVSNSIAGAADYHEAYKKSKELRNKYRWIGADIKFDDIPLDNFFIVNPDTLDNNGNPLSENFLSYNPRSNSRSVYSGNSMRYETVRSSESVTILGYPAKKTVSQGNKERIKEFVYDIEQIAKQGTYHYLTVYLTSLTELTHHSVFDSKTDRVYQWSDVLAKTREPVSVAPKTAGKYHCWNGSGFVLREVKVDEKIVYWSPARDNPKPSMAQVNDIAKNMSEYTLISDNANRHAKIKKDFTDTRPWYQFRHDYEANVAQRDFDKLDAEWFEHYYVKHNVSDDNLGLHWSMHRHKKAVLEALDKLDDKDYARCARFLIEEPKNHGFAATHPDFEKTVKAARPAYASMHVRNTYPMVTWGAWERNPNAVVEYMNYIYAKRKGN